MGIIRHGLIGNHAHDLREHDFAARGHQGAKQIQGDFFFVLAVVRKEALEQMAELHAGGGRHKQAPFGVGELVIKLKSEKWKVEILQVSSQVIFSLFTFNFSLF